MTSQVTTDGVRPVMVLFFIKDIVSASLYIELKNCTVNLCEFPLLRYLLEERKFAMVAGTIPQF